LVTDFVILLESPIPSATVANLAVSFTLSNLEIPFEESNIKFTKKSAPFFIGLFTNVKTSPA